MTISNTSRIAGPFLGNGATTDFPFGFKIFTASDLQVLQTVIATGVDSELILNFDYYVTLNPDQNANPGGTIKILAAPVLGTSIVFTSNLPPTQTLDLTNQGGFYPTVINSAFDRVVILIQQIFSTLRRTVRFPLSDGGSISELPSAGQRAGKLLGFDTNGNFAAVYPAAQSATALQMSLSGSTGANQVGFDGTTLAQQFLGRVQRVVDSIGALRNLSKATYTRVTTTGYYAPGDGGGGDYQYDATDNTSTDNGGTVIVAVDGGRWKLAVSGAVSVRQFGAKGDYVASTATGTDDTMAFRAALATGLNVYVPSTLTGYLLKDSVTLTRISQRIYGDGRYKSNIYIDTTFNMSAPGVLVSAYTCTEYVDLAIIFAQPDTSIKENLTQYPAAISSLGQPGQRILRCRISRAWTAVDWRDNCGQSSIDDLIYSPFNIGIWLDGSLDSVRLNNLHCWPADLTEKQAAILTNGGTGSNRLGAIGVNCGRCDDLKVSNGLFFCSLPFNFFAGTRSNAGYVFGMLENCDLDAFGGITMSAGTVSVTGGFQSSSSAAQVKLTQTGGVLTYTGVNFQIGANFPPTASAAYMNILGGSCSIVGGSMYKPNDACLALVLAGQLLVSGVSIVHQANAFFTYPVFQAGGTGQVTAVGNTCSPLGTGTQPFFIATVDGLHRISQNTFFGHTINAVGLTGYYGGNFNGVANTEFYNNGLTGDLRIARFLATTDASGNFAVPHGIDQAQFKILSASAFYKGASGEARPMTISYVDGVNIGGSGGAASTRCRVTINFSRATDVW